jgi:uncharacterized repeat protein (TIGR03803 family)
VKGTLYGTTSNGVSEYGTVFSITPAGTFKVVYTFENDVTDGAFPESNLIYDKGALYGTTYGGGTASGTVFKVQLTGKQSGQESVLYNFKDSPDGAGPESPLVHVGDAFYGTTDLGGANGGGTVFKVTESGAETVLHSFAAQGSSGGDGAVPAQAGVLYYKGMFYGLTSGGGKYGWGTVYSITKAGKEKVLVNFNASPHSGPVTGGRPLDSLTNIGGTFYGTTFDSSGEAGTVFSVTPSGSLTYLGVFCDQPSGCVGHHACYPESSVIEVGGTLYGTTADICGGSGLGTVWALDL